jgi:nucleoside 2-deoxyribosyltransferase
MPFADPHSTYYEQIYKPAVDKAGLQPVRADAEIFGAGKITDQVWQGIKAAKVLIAELTTRNPNVFYELGVAHALRKPVILIGSNENDVPFDLRNIRVIYYDVSDPFWGRTLIDRLAEEIRAAIKNPKEAIFKPEQEG